MPRFSVSLTAALMLAGCQVTSPPSGAADDRRVSGSADPYAGGTEARLARWEREWSASKQTVTTARSEAIAAGAAIPPEVDRQVTELMDRQIEDDQVEGDRIEDLQNAVSDALRLAELLSVQ